MRKFFYKLILMSLFIVLFFLYLSIQYPIGYVDNIIENAVKYKVDPYLIASMINVESRYDEKAISQKGAKGLMQITESTGKWASEEIGLKNYSDKRLYEPEININIGTWYINRLYKEFDGDLELVLAAYNAGSGNVRKWLKDKNYSSDGKELDNIPFKETRDYLLRVEKNYKRYKALYSGKFENKDLNENNYISYIHEIKRFLKMNDN